MRQFLGLLSSQVPRMGSCSDGGGGGDAGGDPRLPP